MIQFDLFQRPKRIRDTGSERALMRSLRAITKAPKVAGMTRRQIRMLMRPLPPVTVHL